MTAATTAPKTTCPAIEAQLDDYLDGALSPAARAEVESHVGLCGHCRSELEASRRLVTAAAALPRETAPEHDLWPTLVPRLTDRRTAQKPQTPAWAWLSLAAALLITVSAVAVRQLPSRPSPSAAPTGTDAIAEAEAEYERAARELQTALDAQRGTLPPETSAAIERNLALIDQALGEVRQAMRREPGNSAWARMLLQTQRRRVEVLTQAHRLASAL